MINTTIVYSRIAGGTTQSMGDALLENLSCYDEGNPLGYPHSSTICC
ncbi:hypothetical protein ABFA25_04130 [Mycobacterium lepromatosis]